ncbi:hypothetical protein EG329_000683 [Mollisiaceae sp. DMI_Dod_QoI]|nr:hypothetical protein EG329_000683 [Helotiales sp. DMI_Dod_QoI]
MSTVLRPNPSTRQTRTPNLGCICTCHGRTLDRQNPVDEWQLDRRNMWPAVEQREHEPATSYFTESQHDQSYFLPSVTSAPGRKPPLRKAGLVRACLTVSDTGFVMEIIAVCQVDAKREVQLIVM